MTPPDFECKFCTETPCRECAGCAPYVDPIVSADPICESCSADNWTPECLAKSQPAACAEYEDPSCFPPPPPVAPAPPFTCEKCAEKPECTECLECMPLAAPSGTAEFCSECTECPPYIPERLAPLKCTVAPLSGCTEQCQPAKCTVTPLDTACSNEYASKICLESTYYPCTVCEYCTTKCVGAAAALMPECAMCPENPAICDEWKTCQR